MDTSQQFTPAVVPGQLFWQSESDAHVGTHIGPPDELDAVVDELDVVVVDDVVVVVLVVLDEVEPVPPVPITPPAPPVASVSLPDAQAAITAGAMNAKARERMVVRFTMCRGYVSRVWYTRDRVGLSDDLTGRPIRRPPP